MFEDTLLIIKADYMHKRKPVLLKLLQSGFQIQGNRKLQFSPELAAEFLKEMVEDKCFMLQVILLSKGPSEAFILTKENAVTELINTMVCYFSTSQEMDRNVHVTKFPQDVRREITFIFPNYIHEPVPFFQSHKFSSNPLMPPFIEEMYEIMTRCGEEHKHWRVKLAEWLTLTNKVLPHISNQGSLKPCINLEEKGQQVNLMVPRRQPCSFDTVPAPAPAPAKHPCAPPGSGRASSDHTPPFSKSSAGSSMMVTSSSCITCTCFDGTDTCMQPPVVKKDSAVALIAPKMKPLPPSEAEDVEEEHLCEHGFPIYGADAATEEGEGATKTFEEDAFEQVEQADVQSTMLEIQSHESEIAIIPPGSPTEESYGRRLQSIEIVPFSKDQIEIDEIPPIEVPAVPSQAPIEEPVEAPPEPPAPAPAPAEEPPEVPANEEEAEKPPEEPAEEPAEAPPEGGDEPPAD